MPTNQLPKHDPEIQKDQALEAAIKRFHAEGGLWVGAKFLTLDNAYDTAWISDEYEDWYIAKRDAIAAEEQMRLGKEFPALRDRLLTKAIEQIARRHIEIERRMVQEDAA